MIDRMLDDILRREGSRYVDHPADRGGATKFGITLATLQRHRDKPVTKADVKALTEDEARAIYRRDYYQATKIDRMPKGLQPILLDAAVLHGPKRAVMFLQAACNDVGHWDIDVDGICGPVTLKVADLAWRSVGDKLVKAIAAARLDFVREIARRDPKQQVFLAGWSNRIGEFIA